MSTKQAGHAATDSGTDDDPRVKQSKTYLLAAELRSVIRAQGLNPGAPLPSQREIEARYGVSRITVRAAMRALEDEGLIENIPGKGAFVAAATDPAQPVRNKLPAHRFHGAATVRDIDSEEWTEVEAPATFHTNATAEIAANYGVPELTPLFGTDLLLESATGKRMHVKTYLPFATPLEIPALGGNPFVPAARVYELAYKAGLELTFTNYITARNATPDDASALHLPANTALLIIRRIALHNDTPIVIEETTFDPTETPLRVDM